MSKLRFDIGLSYNAPHSQLWLENDPECIVYGFEPNPDCIESLNQPVITKREPYHGDPLSLKNKSRFMLYDCAIDNVSEPTIRQFYCTLNDPGTSSLHKPTMMLADKVKKIVNVNVFPLSFFLEKFDWEKYKYVEYMKIDTQGSDLNVVRSCGKYLDKFVYITLEAETHQYENCENNSVEEMNNFFTNNNFVRVFPKTTSDPTFLNLKYKDIAHTITPVQI